MSTTLKKITVSSDIYLDRQLKPEESLIADWSLG
jgi:hypothetical protein